MSRFTLYVPKVTAGYEKKVSPENQKLVQEFVMYCRSTDKAPQTISQYENWLKIFFCWNADNNGNAFFPAIKKREFVNYFGYLEEHEYSPNRICALRAVLSSLSSEIELLDEDKYPEFHNQIRGLETIHKNPVRQKTVISEDQLRHILSSLVDAKDYQIACYVALLCSSGCRKAEAIQMKASFFTEKNEVFGGFMYKTPIVRAKGRGKAGKRISKYVIKDIFKPYFDLWMNERARLGVVTDALFVHETGKKRKVYEPASINTVNYFASVVGQRFNMDFYAHCLRHYFATYLKGKDLPDDVVTEIFSWASTDMVKVYDDTPKEQKLSRYFGPEGIKGPDDGQKE